MSSSIGEKIKISFFGQSHSKAIGVIIDGLPANEEIDFSEIQEFLNRRAPGKNEISTKRKEEDVPVILSGIVNRKTCGAPLCAVIENSDTKSKDYEDFKNIPRPAHADYTAFVKYFGANDINGGGHFSGRLTAPLCFAGAVCKQILERKGVTIGSHILSVYTEKDIEFKDVQITENLLKELGKSDFPVLDKNKTEEMKNIIREVKEQGDSVGGVIECCAIGVPVGVGEPNCGGLENRLSSAIFTVPAVKGVEFGAGFASTLMKGSENNDDFCFVDGKVQTKTNNHGGILGGISSGMPINMKVAIKPTPSIAKTQKSVNLDTKENTTINIKGRHDPCIVPRAVPCVEAVMAIVLLDLMS